MNKKELAKQVAKKTGMSVSETLVTLNTAFDEIKNSLYRKEKVQLVGFGTFEVRERIARVGKSPQNPAQEISIPAKNVPYFKPGSEMKEGVRTHGKSIKTATPAVKSPASTKSKKKEVSAKPVKAVEKKSKK